MQKTANLHGQVMFRRVCKVRCCLTIDRVDFMLNLVIEMK